MLHTDDIQHFLLTRPPARAARYEFLTFQNPASGRAWLSNMADKLATGESARASSAASRWVTVALTWNGLRALGLSEASLATFPEEFRQGMAARAAILGLTGANHPEHWEGELASPALHAIAILFARDVAERARWVGEHERARLRLGGVNVLSTLDLEALPSAGGAREHFGYRDRLSQLVVEGTDEVPQPGSGPPVKAGEFFLGYADESGLQPILPEPDIVSRHGSYLAYLKLQQHVGTFRDFLRQHGKTPDEQERIAAKLMGRWRSGAPLVLAPDKDAPDLAEDMQRTNNFNYGQMDPYGYACPLGAHIRRMNPRDTVESVERHRMIRRGATYGPLLAEDAPEDNVERGIGAFLGCASLVRQFEFAMNVWTNDAAFKDLGEHDPIIGTQDGSLDMTIPSRPIRKKLKGLPAFTTVRGGAYFFLPGIRALRFLASPGEPT